AGLEDLCRILQPLREIPMDTMGDPLIPFKIPSRTRQARAPPSPQVRIFICHDLAIHGGTMLKKPISPKLTPAEIQGADEIRRMLASQINPTRLKRVFADTERQKQEEARRRAERRKACRAETRRSKG